jgi:hypothetical protein
LAAVEKSLLPEARIDVSAGARTETPQIGAAFDLVRTNRRETFH